MWAILQPLFTMLIFISLANWWDFPLMAYPIRYSSTLDGCTRPENFRASLLGQGMNWLALSLSAVMTVALLISSVYIFKRMEKSFADVV